MQHLMIMNSRAPLGGSISPMGSPVHSFSSASKTDKDVAPFLKNLRKMLDEESDEILRWTPNGRAFEIHDMEQMMEHVLPKYFKHRKYTSFQRQLNYFHFRKWTKSKAVVCTFSNDYFVRDQPELAWRITRKKSLHHHHSHNAAVASPQPAAHALEPKARLSRAHSMPTPMVSTRSRVDSSSSGSPTTTAQQPYWLKGEGVMINVPRSGSLSLPFPSPTDQDMMLKEHDHTSSTAGRRHYFAYPLHHSHSQAHFHQQHQQPFGAPQPTPESLDWIDCLLPPVDRIEDEIYSYMYPAPPVAAAAAGASPALLGAKSSSSSPFEFVATSL